MFVKDAMVKAALDYRRRTHVMRDNEFLSLWISWGFATSGAPEDAASYLWDTLAAIERADGTGDGYLERIGNLDGQQEFILNCLLSMGLIESQVPPRISRLTDLGSNTLRSLEGGIHLRVFCGYSSPDSPDF